MFAETFHLFGTQEPSGERLPITTPSAPAARNASISLQMRAVSSSSTGNPPKRGADQNMDADVGLVSDLFIKGEGGRRTADDKIRAKLEAVCTAFFWPYGQNMRNRRSILTGNWMIS